MFKWPLMKSAFHADDFRAVQNLLGDSEWNLDAKLTQGPQVKAFEEEFAAWQGAAYAVFVNSGASANLLTMAALRIRLLDGAGGFGPGGDHRPLVLVPCITWSSDVTSVLHAGFDPVFVDIDRRTLGMDEAAVWKRIRDKPAAVFVTHCMGYNALDLADEGIYNACIRNSVPLFEDCCEGPGAKTRWAGRQHKVGTFGLAANFSFYYAHHMTTIEGGMITTNDWDMVTTLRRLRGHGLIRESGEFSDKDVKEMYPDLDPQFVFTHEGYNCRSTEINAVIGRSQLKRLDGNIEKRRELLQLFLSHLDPEMYQTDFAVEGSSPYALTLVLKDNDEGLRGKVEQLLTEGSIEYRRGIAGGGSQLRQPYLRKRYGTMYSQFPNAEHVHFNGYCIGLWPSLDPVEIKWLCEKLNKLKGA